MKLRDLINYKIVQYPGLYNYKDWETSSLKVLNHLFLVIGNGYDWAYTKDPKKGGYLMIDQYYMYKGERRRKYDPPYGSIKFNEPITYTNSRRSLLYSEDEILPDFDPYPICGYSTLRELYDNDLFIQPDWLEGAIHIARKSLEYYQDPEQYKYHTYYHSKSYTGIKMSKETKDAMRKVLEELDWYKPTPEPTSEDIQKKKDSWNKYKDEQIAFLTNFLNRYDKGEPS